MSRSTASETLFVCDGSPSPSIARRKASLRSDGDSRHRHYDPGRSGARVQIRPGQVQVIAGGRPLTEDSSRTGKLGCEAADSI